MFQTLQNVLPINLLLCYIIKLSTTQLCDQNSLKKCAVDIHNDPINELVLINVNEPTLNEFCGKYKSFSYCYNSLKPRCFSMESYLASYDGLDNANKYLCETAKQEYLRNLNCFTNSLVQNSSNNCDLTLNIQLNSIKNLDPKGNILLYCKFFDIYLGCLKNVLKGLCSDDAFNWAITYKTLTFEPLLKLYTCPGWDTTTPPNKLTDQNVLILSIVLGLVGFLALLVICILLLTKTTMYRRLVSKFQKKAPNTNSPSPDSNPAPPPSYTENVRLKEMWKQISSAPEESSGNTLSFEPSIYPGNNNSLPSSSAYSSIYPSAPSTAESSNNTENRPNLDVSSQNKKYKNNGYKSDENRNPQQNPKPSKFRIKKFCECSHKRKERPTRSADGSVFATNESRTAGSSDRRSSEYQTYRGSSELSVYALIHQMTDYETKKTYT